MSTERKFTKFGRHLADYRTPPNNVWNYVAYDEKHNACIVIEMAQHSYDCDLQHLITVRHSNSFNLSDRTSLTFEEITEQEFWAAYKMVVVKHLEVYYSHNPDKISWESPRKKPQEAV